MSLHGRLSRIADGRLHFDGDLRERLDAADAVAEHIKDSIDTWSFAGVARDAEHVTERIAACARVPAAG